MRDCTPVYETSGCEQSRKFLRHSVPSIRRSVGAVSAVKHVPVSHARRFPPRHGTPSLPEKKMKIRKKDDAFCAQQGKQQHAEGIIHEDIIQTLPYGEDVRALLKASIRQPYHMVRMSVLSSRSSIEQRYHMVRMSVLSSPQGHQLGNLTIW